ncbi:E3 ubiquitin-protein ligase UBR4, partial [Orchesella cincta]
QSFAKLGFKNEQVITLLSLILKDLDQEKSATEIGAISTMFDDDLNRLYMDFSAEIGKLMQNLLAQTFLSPGLQNYLLDQLSMDLMNTNEKWNLGLHPRALSILVQILLLKPEREPIVASIIKRLLDTLVEVASNQTDSPDSFTDLPVEHAQTMVFLFHTLSLMQKKQVMIETAQALIRTSNHLNGKVFRPHQIMSLSRLLMIFDYFIRQLYEPGMHLITQIQYNLFNDDGTSNNSSVSGAGVSPSNSQGSPNMKTSLKSTPILSKQNDSSTESARDIHSDKPALITTSITSEPPTSKPLSPARIFCDCTSLEREASDDGISVHSLDGPKPRFYNLLPNEPNYQENPRLDGLAMNFLMNKSEGSQRGMDYRELVDSILKIASVEIENEEENKAVPACVAYIQYFITRLMFGLPPPVEYLTSLRQPDKLDSLLNSPSRVMYLLAWLPRIHHRIFASWVRDMLSKQGLSAPEAEELTKSSTLSTPILMKSLLCATDWLSNGKLKSPSHSPAYFYAVEASLIYCINNINELLDDTEMVRVLSTLLNQTLQAIRDIVINKALSNSRSSLSDEERSLRIKSACHLMSIGSGYLMNNPLSLILLRHIETEFKSAMDTCVAEDFSSFPDVNGNSFKTDIIPSESFLLAVIGGSIETSQGCLKHILGLVIKIFGAAVSSKNTKVPKALRDELSSLLYPLLVDRTAEYLGEYIGASIDPVYSKTDVPLNANLVEIIGTKALQAVCYPELRSIIAETNQNRFLEECLDALSSLLAGRDKGKLSEFEDLFFKSLFANSGELLRGLLKLLISVKNDGVVVKVCKFLSLLLDKEAKEKHSRKVQEALLSEDLVTLDDLPSKLFSPDLFQNELVVEAACGFLSNILGVLSKEGDQSALLMLLQKTLDVTSINFNLSTKPIDQEAHVDTSGSLCHVLKILIQMACVCETEEGHVLLFRQMIEWLYGFTDSMEAHLIDAIANGAGLSALKKESETLKTKSLNSNLAVYMTIMEYILDVGRAVQTVANQTPGMLEIGKITGSALLLQRFSDKEREQTPGGNSPPNELDDTFDLCDSELGDDQGDDDESVGEDSDDEGLNSRLCTYTITQKEFMSQHWYHCHTCGMVDGVGVCSVCAKVCHRGHDVTYAKFGSFFCDCGAKTDGSCLALVRRPNVSVSDGLASGQNANNTQSAPSGNVTSAGYNPFLSDSLVACTSGNAGDNPRRPSSPTFVDYKTAITTAGLILNSQLTNAMNESAAKGTIKLKASFKWEELLQTFKTFSSRLPLLTVSKLRPVVKKLASVKTPIGAYLRVQNALDSLRNGKDGQLEFRPTDDLVIPTLGSQEGAFENIKMTYNGDQGSVIRQLIVSQVIRRNAIASLSAPSIRRHYLAVSQEKGKVTVLQLGALLSGADTGKKKLTLPRLATITLPFTVLTMASNPMRDDVLAVCGLKDCHILVVGTGGSISSHLVLQPQLESQNHILKPLWLPGSQTSLALLTADAVKVYDLGKDVISPMFYFLLPSGKVRDATFVIQGDVTYILVMANDGRIYSEKLDDSTSAANGPYYITNDLNYDDTEMLSSADNSGANSTSATVNSGTGTAGSADKKESIGLSLYYSHALRLLFYTYPNGKSYVGTLEDLSGAYPLNKAVLITNKASGSGKSTNLGLSQWLEVIGHPGLLFAMGKDGTPYAMLMTESGSEIQEIKVVGKLRPIDMIGIRHVGQPGKIKTSLLILCEDGSLRVCDSSEPTEFWLNPRLRPHPDTVTVKSSGSKKSNARKVSRHLRSATGQLSFPVDFFEHCQSMNDIEFGGNDLLQIYNVAQLKNRLNSAGMYVVSTKSIGFNLEVVNNDGSMVITGIRVLLGSQETTKVPSFIQVFGRTITVTISRARWYDIPLTREESLQADTKLTITFGPSNDSQSITFVDSVKIYGKSKDAFGWPDDSEELASTQCIASNGGSVSTAVVDKLSWISFTYPPIRIITGTLELCELAVTLCPKELGDVEGALDIVTEIYLENYPSFNSACRSLMCTILSNRAAYYEHKDKAVFTQCALAILEMHDRPEIEIDPEYFHHIISCMKNIATIRPLHIAHFDYSVLGGVVAPMSTTKVIETMCKIFQKLVDIKPKNPHIVPVDRPGIQRVDILAMGLADIIYSLMVADVSLVPKLSPCLIKLLLSRNTQICVPVRTVLVKRLRPKNVRKRRVTIPGPSPPHCATPDTAAESPRENVPGEGNIGVLGQNAANIVRNPEVPQLPLVEVDEPIVMLEGHDNDVQLPILNPLEAFIGPEGFAMAQGIDLQSDAEDEAMVELAIALSLQEQAGGLAMPEGLQVLEDMHQEVLHAAEAISPPEDEPEQGMIPGGSSGEGGAESDATASPPPSDDEGSTVATEGSTMRNSEPGGSESSGSSNAGGSSNGRSGPVSGISTSASSGAQATYSYSFISNLSNMKLDGEGESSGLNEPGSSKNQQSKSEKERVGTGNPGTSAISLQTAIRPFRLAIMKAISTHIAECKDALSVIPLLQVLLVILAELDGSYEEEVEIVETLVQRLMDMMNLSNVNQNSEWKRNESSEMTLIVLRMLSILVSRWRGSDQKSESSWIARTTADTVQKSGIVICCKELLCLLRPTWKGYVEEPEKNNAAAVDTPSAASVSAAPVTPDALGSSLLKPSAVPNPPDYSPFFLKQYVKTHCNDVLEELPLLLSEMALRLPYQVKKVLNQQAIFDSDWEELLCEMLQNRNAPFVRRQARKLLLNIAGTRENYHLLRDLHNIKYHLAEFKKLIGYDGNTESERFAKSAKMEFKYTQLVAMVEHLNTCIDIATQRPASWQTFCKNEDALPFIVQMGCTADESLTTALLTLLKIAVDGVAFDSKSESPMLRMSEDEKALKSLAHQIIDNLEQRTFLEFVKKYLLEHPLVTTRWQAHSLLLGIFLTSDCSHQLKLVHAMWELWPFVPAAGSRASQFVDILGYATLNNDDLKARDLRKQVNLCIESIESQGKTLLAHPNANIYSSLVPFVSVDGYYLESEPCEVCHNIDKPYAIQKLNSIKADAKFTANSQIVKLTSTLSVIRLSVRLTEIKKARMIKTLAVYYSPKNVPIVELKNKPSLWQMARKVTLNPSQTEIKLDFSVPITAANIMLEFLDFYENVQGTAETLQCPRCSASVPAQPGVCSNCGENVFQCHKCRSINYDERDPFLCHSCGFCKYAKLEISVLAKNIVAVDPIENEEDHKKAETAVSSLLEKADQTFKQQQCIKACLETMLQSIKERRSMSGLSGTTNAMAYGGTQPAVMPVTSSSGIIVNGNTVSLPTSYASAAAAAVAASNAVNNNLASNASNNVGGNNNNASNNLATGSAASTVSQIIGGATSASATGSLSSGSSSLVLKNVQSLAYCYAIDCKNSYEELNRLMRKVGAYRKEMLKLDPTAYALDTMDNITFRRCYGCMASSITLSLKLLQALITAGSPRDPFDLSFLSFLLRLSQSAGSTALKEQVKNALCFFVKDDSLATSQLTDMINTRVIAALNKESWSDVSFETSEEISLLSSLLQMYDSCWEIKLKSLMKIFTHAVNRLRDPSVTETGLLPCLKIIHNFIRTTQSGEREKITVAPVEGVHANIRAWINGDPKYSFESWKKTLPKVKGIEASATSESTQSRPVGKESARKEINSKKSSKVTAKNKEDRKKGYLMKKYGRIWLDRYFKLKPNAALCFDKHGLIWLKKLLFCPGSVQTRTITASLLKDLAQIPQRRLKIMELLTEFLEDLPSYGESCREFMDLYRSLATPQEFSAFLNAKGALSIVCRLLDKEIEKLHHLESVTLHSDLSQGIAVWELSRLLSAMAIPSVRRNRRVSLLSTVLSGYLALKRLKLHRTRPIEEAQEILLQLLEEITSGTEEETKIFMTVCVETLKKCSSEDLATPVFIFERLCSLIVHEENDVGEFFVALDKDPQQEDFLQGRMLGNPYSSNETGIGPLMRDIKNKICTDCELVALLEDDNGMELLVNNKIISLDLPVKEVSLQFKRTHYCPRLLLPFVNKNEIVYKKLWLPTNGQIEPMRIVYRMRGLLGDATEEFVESFASPNDSPEDNEKTYKLANVLVECGGLRVALTSLENLFRPPLIVSRVKPLIAVILKLLGYCTKIVNGRQALTSPSLNSVQTLLPILQLCLENDLTFIQGSSGVVHLTDQVLEILDIIVTEACGLDKKAFTTFAKTRGSVDDVRKLLLLSDKLKSRQATMSIHFKVLAGLTYTDKVKMSLIFDSFKDCFDFFQFDEDPNGDFTNKLEHICTLVSNIQSGSIGATFKDLAIERNVIEHCLTYIKKRAPYLKAPLGRPDSEEWKEMVSKPALKYVLRLLAGLASDHVPCQEAIGKEIVCVIHQLEQVSSDEHVGSLAENALEALRSHDQLWKEVEAARRATREEKKRMAMAMRQRQLNTMGMKTNEKGQVTAAVSTILDQMEDLAEETGLVCVICREGYKYQPTKVLGIYTYSKRCPVEELETKSRKTYGYCTVSHFNIVHVDCHMAAIRLARSRDEWESASLQNANTRCNGLIPLWGQQVPESAFAACLARHNAYLQEATGSRDVGFSSGAHDIKLLLLRFADEKSFHEDTGGGGPESNLHLVPYLIHTALYVLNTTRASAKEGTSVEKFLNAPMNIWKDDATTVDGVYYNLVVSMMVHSPAKWMENRMQWVKRVLATCGFRSKQQALANFGHYRAGLIFLGLIHGLYTIVFQDVASTGEWPSMLADYIRKNDEGLVKSTSALLNVYQQKFVPASKMSDFIEFLQLHETPELTDMTSFTSSLWNALG